MEPYISKSALVAEIEKRRDKNARNKLFLAAAFEDNYLLSFIDTLEVKEVDLNVAVERYVEQHKSELNGYFDIRRIAKHFFELGTSVNNPITSADIGTAEEIIISPSVLRKTTALTSPKK